MKLLFCGIGSSDDRFRKILNETKTAPFAQQKLERMMLRGLTDKEGVEILSVLPVQRYPRYPEKVIHGEEDILENKKVQYIGFVNLPVLKQLTTFFSFAKGVLKWARKNRREERVVLLYGTNPLQVLPLIIVRLFTKVKIVSYVSEIDSLRLLDNQGIIKRIKNRIFVRASSVLSDALDAYIYVSKYMGNEINKRKKPAIVIEGMVDKEHQCISQQKRKEIMYAGSLHKRYGIEKLVKAFEGLEQSEYKLVIYGDGDFVPELKKIAVKNPQIVYKGTAENEIILKAENEATLLVNPRPSSEKFTIYSFPSKTFEYMLSGTACLITKLGGIPDEYFEYCYTFDEESVESMTNTLKNILSKSNEEHDVLAKKAYNYVIQEKNNYVQMGKIWKFISGEYENV